MHTHVVKGKLPASLRSMPPSLCYVDKACCLLMGLGKWGAACVLAHLVAMLPGTESMVLLHFSEASAWAPLMAACWRWLNWLMAVVGD